MIRYLIADRRPMRYIYVLLEPDADIVRYVGQTTDPKQRLVAHLACPGENKAKDEWIKRLKTAGLKPRMEVVQRTKDNHEAALAEEEWIEFYRVHHHPVLNGVRPYVLHHRPFHWYRPHRIHRVGILYRPVRQAVDKCCHSAVHLLST